MGDVWRAEHLGTGIAAAIKLLRPEAERFRGAFASEIAAVTRLDHPGIIHIYDQGEVSDEEALSGGGWLRTGQLWMAMEYCSGGTLEGFAPGF